MGRASFRKGPVQMTEPSLEWILAAAVRPCFRSGFPATSIRWLANTRGWGAPVSTSAVRSEPPSSNSRALTRFTDVELPPSSASTCAGSFGRTTTIRVLALAALGLGAAPAGRAAPEDIFINGTVATVDADFSLAQAFAVEGGRLVAVGANAEVRATAGPQTRTHDLKGAFVLP